MSGKTNLAPSDQWNERGSGLLGDRTIILSVVVNLIPKQLIHMSLTPLN